MKKEFIEQLNNLNLTKEEKILIKKISKNLSGLQEEAKTFLNKDNFFIESKDLKSIFFENSQSENLMVKYQEILNDLKNGINKILIRGKEKVETNKPIVKNELENETSTIITTIQNLNRFFLLSTKTEIISKLREINKTVEVERRDYYINKLKILEQEIEDVIKNDELVEIDLLKKDLELIRNLKITKNKKMFKKWEIIVLILFAFLVTVSFILGITFLII